MSTADTCVHDAGARGSRDHDGIFINGGRLAPTGSDRAVVHSPFGGTAIVSVPESSATDVDTAVPPARAQFYDPAGRPNWTTFRRASALEDFAAALERRSGWWTTLITHDSPGVVGPVVLSHLIDQVQ